ncbi:hypothetical protein JX266_005192 [Neoarthrinium moseri]|nr:hypothetical protein JX266_005192 [Neoarthrinium moseri]
MDPSELSRECHSCLAIRYLHQEDTVPSAEDIDRLYVVLSAAEEQSRHRSGPRREQISAAYVFRDLRRIVEGFKGETPMGFEHLKGQFIQDKPSSTRQGETPTRADFGEATTMVEAEAHELRTRELIRTSNG